MSVLSKKWVIKNEDNQLGVIEKLLNNRSIIDKDLVQNYLYPSYKKGFHNPFLMKDMDKAVERIKRGVANNEKMMIFGDYDVDGISGTAILYNTLKKMGARLSYRLPHRVKDGYGLSNAFVEEFAEVGAKLVITVDCGISCRNQIKLAKEKGIDIIITDHHTIPEQIPEDAYAILHPNQPGCDYPFKGLTGAGVAYKLASALITDVFSPEEREEYLYSLLDLASLGTVADIGPIMDENRIIVKYGLEALQNTKWYGLQLLKELSGVEPNEKLDIGTIGFRISPRINAAGRIDHPYYSLQLLINANEDPERGKLLAQHLEKLNQERQQMVAKAMEEAETQYIDLEKQKIIIAWSPDWHVGILGLIAGKLAEKYGKPAMIMQDFGEHLVASARCPEIFNITEALTAHKDLFETFGGHAQAAGFTVKKENLQALKDTFEQYSLEKLANRELKPNLNIDCELKSEDINQSFVKFLEQMEPFGTGNEQPLFVIRNMQHSFAKRVGKEQNHLSFQATVDGRRFPVIAYRLGQFENDLKASPNIDLVCHLEENFWKGTTHLQLRAIDFKPTETI